jgi:hypothetical protein
MSRTTLKQLEEIKKGKLEIDNSHKPNFIKWRGDKTLFVETGTNFGNGLNTALNCGFTRGISVEIDSKLFFANQFKYAKHDNVKLFLGDSKHIFPLMLSLVDEPAFFWLDAHHSNGGPAFEELENLKKHHIKNHTILIDDIPVHFGGDLRINLEQLIMEINPEYTIEYADNHFSKDYILVANVQS